MDKQKETDKMPLLWQLSCFDLYQWVLDASAGITGMKRMEYRVKTITSQKPSVFYSYLRNKIYFSNKYLQIASDNELKGCFYHELGHKKHMKHYVLSQLIILECFAIGAILFPLLLLPFFLLFYLCVCYLARCNEYLSDEYALDYTDRTCMYEFLFGLGSRRDTFFTRYFPLFCLHPSVKKRWMKITQKTGDIL